MSTLQKTLHRLSRKRRSRAKISGTAERPRLSVFRSLSTMSVQVIDDTKGVTLVSANTKALKAKPNTDGAKKLGDEVGKQLKAKKIDTIVFDRNGYRYHGRIATLADAVREAGITF